ncbi:MAG TPA: 5-(carboxyamino)imidazole ribonucleotide synthase [Oligoflexus sp.]|uniref:5-(carboxyamino)imidazole ribonucleotide synthase n=1 Tax=Oligoflexus sp. TaxID=1971216 RepID=UPI002D7EBF6B|nr:5-(carboxyamino)imidazole ribonucleotide synthase [Oligoflexus sp.]HET9235727.1 5-(carboxyamino)imidazole ribonucleotide synthase [Oligoflexus sp.]
MRVGFLGGGQLARMMGLAGYPLGLRFRCLDPNPESPAADVMEHVQGPLNDPDALRTFAKDLDCITIESENIPVSTLENLILHGSKINPGIKALATSQDRLYEKTTFQKLGIPTADFANIASREELEHEVRSRGGAFILKTRREGYDGKGQFRIKSPADVDAAWAALGGKDLILEKWLGFDAECSLISVRDVQGNTRFYPLVHNVHKEGILFTSESWTTFSKKPLQSKAEAYAQKVMQELDYVGVLTIEFFVMGDELIANEMAPRVHNSGHWTIEGAVTSQFENHLRAILGLPLGSTDLREPFTMINVVGYMPPAADLLKIDGLCLHDYRKKAAPRRKLGHITLLRPSQEKCDAVMKFLK